MYFQHGTEICHYSIASKCLHPLARVSRFSLHEVMVRIDGLSKFPEIQQNHAPSLLQKTMHTPLLTHSCTGSLFLWKAKCAIPSPNGMLFWFQLIMQASRLTILSEDAVQEIFNISWQVCVWWSFYLGFIWHKHFPKHWSQHLTLHTVPSL